MNVPFHNSFYSQLQLSLHLFIKLKIIYTIDNTIFLYSLSRISKMVKIKCHINTLLALVISNYSISIKNIKLKGLREECNLFSQRKKTLLMLLHDMTETLAYCFKLFPFKFEDKYLFLFCFFP